MNNLLSLLVNGRAFSSTRSGGQFGALQMMLVWEKGRPARNQAGQIMDPKRWRIDACGTPMDRTKYGDTNSEYGWEIDHIFPVGRGGTDDMSNLQPLNWKNNRKKGDGIFQSAALYRA